MTKVLTSVAFPKLEINYNEEAYHPEETRPDQASKIFIIPMLQDLLIFLFECLDDAPQAGILLCLPNGSQTIGGIQPLGKTLYFGCKTSGVYLVVVVPHILRLFLLNLLSHLLFLVL